MNLDILENYHKINGDENDINDIKDQEIND